MHRFFSKLHIGVSVSSKASYARMASSTPKPAVLPVKAPGAYALYIKENFKKNNNSKATEQIAALAKQWSSLSMTEKEKYKTEAVKINKEKLADFAKLPKDVQQQQIDEAKAARSDRKKKRYTTALKKFCKDTNRPTRPLTSFLMFQLEKFPVTKKEEVGSKAKEAAEAYRQLSEAEKKKYDDKYAEQSKAYQIQRDQWVAKHGKAYEKLKMELGPVKPKKAKKRSVGLAGRLKRRGAARNKKSMVRKKDVNDLLKKLKRQLNTKA